MSDENRELNKEIESGEQWLRGVGTPGPSAERVARVKQAIRAELASAPRRATSIWSTMGRVAMAACLLAAVYVGWLATRGTPVKDGVRPIAKAPTPVKVEPKNVVNPSEYAESNEVYSDSSVAMSSQIDEGLSNLEEWSKDSTWDLSGNSLSAALDAVYGDAPITNGNGRKG
ncbi:MAG: hypothetical protein HZA51_11800 [Planctomycetes bacterium]|nr:hypothetical protein [Planctomycetota bacterium]